MTSRQLDFFKLQATGNDFIFFPTDPGLSKQQRAHFCSRRTGIGADGLVVAASKPGEPWLFFNSDGEEAEFCGNAALCQIYFHARLGAKKSDSFRWQSKAGELSGSWDQQSGKATLEFSASKTQVLKLNMDSISESISGLNEHGLAEIHLIDAGVPHLVLVSHESWPDAVRLSAAPSLRAHSAFGPGGVNVTWFSPSNKEVVTYERGVEAETLGCGSGALAVFISQGAKKSETYRFPGGQLELSGKKKEYFQLAGQPKLVFSGQIGQ